jgi:RND family efflux transporter MFP subunit
MSAGRMRTGFVVLAGAASTWAAAAQPLGCLIEPHRAVDVGSPVIGVVESVKVERGDRVSKGEVLAVLRSDVERAAVDVAASRAKVDAEMQAAQANHELARQKHARAVDLRSRNFISEQALEQARAEAEVARQRLAQAREQRRILARELQLAEAQLGLRTIRSPADGIVTERYMSGGERVEEKPIVRVATIDPLRVEVVVPASLYGTIVPGALLNVTPELRNAAPRPAKVVLVDAVVDGPSNTFRIRLELPNPNYELPAGLRCKVELGAILPADKTTPQTTPPAPALREDEVMQAVGGWAKAWSDQDVPGYLAHYAPQFETPPGMSRAAWEAERMARIAKPRTIAVAIESPQVRFEGDGRAVVTFAQRYRSDAFETQVQKTLILVRSGSRWLIHQEARQ